MIGRGGEAEGCERQIKGGAARPAAEMSLRHFASKTLLCGFLVGRGLTRVMVSCEWEWVSRRVRSSHWRCSLWSGHRAVALKGYVGSPWRTQIIFFLGALGGLAL